MQFYFLAPHVYPCVTEDHVVLLDLRRDKYVGIGRDHMATLARCVKGWPVAGVPAASGGPAEQTASGPPPVRAETEGVLARMLAAGMLTTDPARGKEATPVQVPRAEDPLVEEDLEQRPEVTFIDVCRFLLASALTALSLKCRPIASVMEGVRARKARATAGGRRLDRQVARRAVAAFIRLRPLLFGAQDACLFDSLALMRYLAWYRVFPTCVIGVTTKPFAAHCWVQEADVVFNDAPEYVRQFTPILAV